MSVQQKLLQIGVITLFPQMFAALNYGIVGRALEKQLLKVHYWDPRDYSQDKHRQVDDKSYGGGPGMVMMVQPLRDAILAAKQTLGETTRVIYLSPQGSVIDQHNDRDRICFARLANYPGMSAHFSCHCAISHSFATGNI